MGASATYGLMLRYLRENPEGMTGKELAHALGLHPTTVQYHLRNARAKGDAHIGSWQVDSSVRLAVWVAGPGRDAKRPPTISGKEASARYRRRHRARIRLKKRAKRGTLTVFSQVTV